MGRAGRPGLDGPLCHHSVASGATQGLLTGGRGKGRARAGQGQGQGQGQGKAQGVGCRARQSRAYWLSDLLRLDSPACIPWARHRIAGQGGQINGDNVTYSSVY